MLVPVSRNYHFITKFFEEWKRPDISVFWGGGGIELLNSLPLNTILSLMIFLHHITQSGGDTKWHALVQSYSVGPLLRLTRVLFHQLWVLGDTLIAMVTTQNTHGDYNTQGAWMFLCQFSHHFDYHHCLSFCPLSFKENRYHFHPDPFQFIIPTHLTTLITINPVQYILFVISCN
jgi:hypothetical protein